MNGRAVQAAAIGAVAVFGVWLLFFALPRRYSGSRVESPAAPAGAAAAAPERKITATLYYIAEDGMALVGVQREVPFGEPVAEQARRIVEAQLAAAPQPLAAAVPDGTTLRAVYVTERDCDAAAATCQRDAFVDLSAEARTRHTGGALDELFTIYAHRRRDYRQPAGDLARADPRRRQGSGHARRSCRPAASAREEPEVGENGEGRLMSTRIDGRAAGELRETKITPGFLMHAEGSVLIEVGRTRVVCTASVEERVPQFLRNTGKGWVTAEYGMLPRATSTRTQREASAGKVGGRTQEIQRLIGRSLRSVARLNELGERTIWVDCDVIQADGGTRTASITGGFVALVLAMKKMREAGILRTLPVQDFVAATSVGVVGGTPMLDLAYEEDSRAEVDMNVVKTGDGRFVEVQGTAEGPPFERAALDGLLALADAGIQQLVEMQRAVTGPLK